MEHILSKDKTFCVNCGLIAVKLTTDCPGHRVSMERALLVQQDKTDYRDDVGWVVGPKRE